MNLSIVYGRRLELIIKILIQALKVHSCCVIRINQHKGYKEDIVYDDNCIQITKTQLWKYIPNQAIFLCKEIQ